MFKNSYSLNTCVFVYLPADKQGQLPKVYKNLLEKKLESILSTDL